MDPNANLTEQLNLARAMVKSYDAPDGNGIDQDDSNRLAELVIALDQWLVKGGFKPTRWEVAS
jgi:hypothetical protein